MLLVKVKQYYMKCKSNRYYSIFNFTQIDGAQNYMELDYFDLFGSITMRSRMTVCKKYSMFSLLRFLFVSCQ